MLQQSMFAFFVLCFLFVFYFVCLFCFVFCLFFSVCCCCCVFELKYLEKERKNSRRRRNQKLKTGLCNKCLMFLWNLEVCLFSLVKVYFVYNSLHSKYVKAANYAQCMDGCTNLRLMKTQHAAVNFWFHCVSDLKNMLPIVSWYTIQNSEMLSGQH